MLEAKDFLLSPAELGVLISLKHTKEKEGEPFANLALPLSLRKMLDG